MEVVDYTWASIVSADRVVFDILTNRYRLVTAVDFVKGHRLDQMDRDAQRVRQDDAKKVKYARY